MLSIPWEQRQGTYEFAVIGSGYGGAITAARISAALGKQHALCVLERGKEWEPGKFPNDVPGILNHARSDLNPLGLYEFLNYPDISIIKGSGLGGTSLINANVAIVPDAEVYQLAGWPRALKYDELLPYYERAREVLAAKPVPGAMDLLKVQALERRARQLGTHAQPLNIAVNFDIEGNNAYGMEQHKCVKCGDCVTGCNFHAKNTLYMNYLPMAVRNGADIFTQVKVEWLEKLRDDKGWRIHGRYVRDNFSHETFTMDCRNVVLSAGAVNSTEILLRSEMHGLKVSPALGTGFSGNGDFFGLAYNGNFETDVLGYGGRVPAAGDSAYPGPSIVGVVKYNGTTPVQQRIAIEDFSFPSAYVAAAKIAFSAIRGDRTVVSGEDGQQQRVLPDFDPSRPYVPDGALNHTMLYLVMGQDNARGTMNFEAPLTEPDGRMSIAWDQAGQQVVFTRMNEELRRHARALGANYISNPTWNVFHTGHLITAHPLGGCPMGEDYLHGAVDQFGRVFSGDGSVHDGLMVTDGSLIPSALGVNPFLTISALTERNAERKVQDMQGKHYPKPPVAVSMAGLDPLEVITRTEPELEKLFRRLPTLGIDKLMNQGGAPTLDIAAQTVRNDRYWKGFFPKGHVLNALSSAIFTGFKKTFHKQGNEYVGITSDTDNRIQARNSLKEITLDRQTGPLPPGKYILLSYLDPQWSGFYDVLKVVSDDLVVGWACAGAFPNGLHVMTFAMSRLYGFQQMTVDDHSQLFQNGAVPTKDDLNGVWQMDVISNNNHLARAAYLQFDLKPDGRLESRYQLLGLMDGLVVPSFTQDHFQLNDFTMFHDEIRRVSGDLMVGRYITGALPDPASLLNGADMGIFHSVPGTGQTGFYYTLSRVGASALPTTSLLRQFLDVQLPDGVGMTFDETMVGYFFEGASTPSAGKEGDLTIAGRIPSTGSPAGAVPCNFQARMTVRDVNEFVDGAAHEAQLSGSISFGRLHGQNNVTLAMDEDASRFNYLRVNPNTGQAEMRYHIEFASAAGERFVFEGRKYMEKNGAVGGPDGIQELLSDYTTLYCHVFQKLADGSQAELGIAYLRFKTFEDLAAVRNLAGFLASFQVTGTSDPVLQLQARMRFLAFTGQFVQREYDPLAPAVARAAH